MLLALDVGNTNVTIGIFDGADVVATWRIATDMERLADEYAVLLLGLLRPRTSTSTAIDEAVMASVVPDLAPVFEQLCRALLPRHAAGRRHRHAHRHPRPLRQPARGRRRPHRRRRRRAPPVRPAAADHRRLRHRHRLRRRLRRRRVPGRRHRPRHRHLLRSAVRAGRQAIAGRAGAAENSHREEHRRLDPVRRRCSATWA